MFGKFAHRGPEVMALVVGEVVCAVRSYPWRRRNRAYAAGVLLDAKHALWHGELTPIDPHRPGGADLVDPAVLAQARAGHAVETAEVRLVDLLLWAVESGAISSRAAQLLLDTEHAASYGTGGRIAAAKAAGIPERTFCRHRKNTIAAMTTIAADYLAAMA